MKNIFKTGLISAILSTLLFAGCTGDFDEINTDPDAYIRVPHTNVLARVLVNTGTNMGGDMDGFGTWAGYITKIQYLDYMSSFIPSNNTYGNRWSAAYFANSQFKEILKLTEAEPEANKNIRLVCRLWQEYMWMYLLDGWGDIPYSEALQGSEEEGSVLESKYDKQEELYPMVLENLKKIADEMAAGFGTDKLGEGDFLYAGDMEGWQRFCNSLRLRLAMRLVGVMPDAAKSTVEEIAGNPSKYPFIDSTSSQCYFWWQGSGDYFERWYDNRRTRDDHGVSDIFINHLKEMQDPRLHVIAKPAASDGEYRGFQNGPSKMPDQLNTISRIGAIYRDNPSGFTPYYKASESYYILAEAAMLGWNVDMTAQEAYETAVMLSMEENGVSDEDAAAYLAGAGKWNNTMQRIWDDMWVALFKNNFEAWCLYRRTGTPTTNYIAIESVWKGIHNDQPFRMPYPENQYLFNTTKLNEAVSSQGIVDFVWGKQLWWDKRTGVF